MELSQDNIDSLEQMLSVGVEFNQAVEIIEDVRKWLPSGVIRCLAICKLSPEGLRIARELKRQSETDVWFW